MRAKIKRIDRGLTATRAILLVAAVGLVGVLAYRQISRLSSPKVPVWVSATEVAAGQTLGEPQLKLIQMDPPKGALVKRADIAGRTLQEVKAEGEPFHLSDLRPLDPPPQLSTTIPEGRLLATLRIAALDLPMPELRPGDRLEIVDPGFHRKHPTVDLVAHDVYMMGTVSMKPPPANSQDSGIILGVDISVPGSKDQQAGGSALVFALRPMDVFPLAVAEASGRKLKLVLHSDPDVKNGKLLDLRPPPIRRAAVRARPSVELVMGAKRETVYVRN